MTRPAYQHNGAPVSREAFYAIACDPRRSVAVEACAGAGKTWMLVSRILRALLAGAAPHEILAITFTKKAAGEMRERLQEWLEAFSRADPARLRAELLARGVANADADAMCAPLAGLARQMLASGRPVQIRTFHSWFAALLRSAPLAVLAELGLPGSYELLEDDTEAVRRVWRPFHAAIAADPAQRADFEAVVAEHGRFQTQKALAAVLARRVEFALADQAGHLEGSVLHFAQRAPSLATLEAPWQALAGDIARRRWGAWAAELGREANKTPQAAAAAVIDAFAMPDGEARLAALRSAFFVKDEDRLSRNLQKFPQAQAAEAELQTLCAAQAQHAAWLHQQRMVRLSRTLLDEFAALKRERGWVDMNDVERAALRMLSDPVLGAWVQERLDARIRHLLIDEFQDTNPLQWQALNGWLASYAGAGGAAPSVFIVGDPKQSIYRFRRAEPQVFVDAKAFIAQALGGDLLSCDHTHRNALRVVGAVNGAMTAAQVAGEFSGFRAHTTEATAEGAVRCLPQVEREKAERVATQAELTELPGAWEWRDSLTVPRELPEDTLRAVECRQAARWVASQLARSGGGLLPRDVMVLARKRDRLAVMQDELRALHIPAQQPEKTDLADVPEVQDVIALVDALVSPQQDLSLARALKSPLFGMDDAALAQIALLQRSAGGEGDAPAWFDLLQRRGLPPVLAQAGPVLARWKAWIDSLPPHDALDAIYHDGDVLARFGAAAPAALRGTVLANLRALLAAALQVDGARYATPYGLVRAVRAGGLKAPVATSPDAVRLLTVHGAKGLEARLVLLLDTDAAPPAAETMGVLVDWPGGEQFPGRFVFMASESRPPACALDLLASEREARNREELNALYVALTRARDQLVVSAVQSHRAGEGSWWQRLQPLCDPVDAPPQPTATAGGVVAAAHALDGAAFTLAVLPDLPDTLRAVHADAGQPQESAQARIGQAMHRLLEWGVPGEAASSAQVRAAAREFMLSASEAERAQALARQVREGAGSWAWDDALLDWHGNEVALFHEGRLQRLDRLVRRRDTGHWWVLDYKSASRPERDAALLAQMRAYRSAVQDAHPGAVVRVAFMTGQGEVVEIE